MTARPVIEARCEGATRCVMPRQTCPRPNGFGRNLCSKTRWFKGFCNSHQLSHFATFFIDARAEISVAESCFRLQKKHRYAAQETDFEKAYIALAPRLRWQACQDVAARAGIQPNRTCRTKLMRRVSKCSVDARPAPAPTPGNRCRALLPMRTLQG
ncbi:hypothetical protein CQW23_34081 [Capsicum baccatum]|uniref:Uncharacterized protein n=1 Tax=Capsicum baccatum TaxID=33114 RepID=A0A2G2UZV8_CAPBA|nr:hypothetical protein CQW23_34081 [Capsicum baccatum]